MHSSLKSLLEKTEENISKIEKDQSQITCLILGLHEVENCENLLLQQLRELKRYVNEFIISIPEKLEITDPTLLLELDALSVKLVEQSVDSGVCSISTLANMFDECLTDRVFLIPFDLLVSKDKIEKLLSQQTPLATFLGNYGNFNSSLAFYNRWINRFDIQILLLNERRTLDDLIRVCSSKVFFQLAQDDKISRRTAKNENLDDSSKNGVYHTISIHSAVDIQNIIKALSLLHFINSEIEEKKTIKSQFKLQQLLILSQKFSEIKQYNLAFQLLLFLLRKQIYIEKLPIDWTLEKIKELSRKQLLEEEKLYSQKGVERLRLQCLSDLVEYDLAKDIDKDWIEKEIKETYEKLQKDNVIGI